MRAGKLDGMRVLLVEDEALVAMLIEDMLEALGCAVVGLASTVEDALHKIPSLAFDVAILDVNLNGAESFSVAFALARADAPFLFSTGYGVRAIPDAFRGIPVLGKPFTTADLEQTLASVLAARPNSLS